ncbi:MAG: hypothetical protein HOP29_02360 [Phycisphaerales bacterium]|nr:hypothetical protein [Phycisphaerales bacterium]
MNTKHRMKPLDQFLAARQNESGWSALWELFPMGLVIGALIVLLQNL